MSAIRSSPSTMTARSQVRWFSPTWSRVTRSGSTPNRSASRRWSEIATLQSPTARWPSSRSACVTSPVGLVKSTNHAPGAPRRAVSSASSRTTGTVRSAFANPPAPVVSWPMNPNRPGIVSSDRRAVWPPTRSCTITKCAPSSASSRRSVRTSRPAHPTRRSIRSGQGPDDLEALGIGIQQDELVHGQPVGAGHQSLDELRRVRASPAGDGHLHTHGTASYTAAVKSLGNFPDPFSAEIAGQPEALRRAAAGLRDQREHAPERWPASSRTAP